MRVTIYFRRPHPRYFYLSEHIRIPRHTHARHGPRHQSSADQEFGRPTDLEGHGRLVLLLGACYLRVVIAHEEGLARLCEEAGGEEEARAAWRGEGLVQHGREEG